MDVGSIDGLKRFILDESDLVNPSYFHYYCRYDKESLKVKPTPKNGWETTYVYGRKHKYTHHFNDNVDVDSKGLELLSLEDRCYDKARDLWDQDPRQVVKGRILPPDS